MTVRPAIAKAKLEIRADDLTKHIRGPGRGLREDLTVDRRWGIMSTKPIRGSLNMTMLSHNTTVHTAKDTTTSRQETALDKQNLLRAGESMVEAQNTRMDSTNPAEEKEKNPAAMSRQETALHTLGHNTDTQPPRVMQILPKVDQDPEVQALTDRARHSQKTALCLP